VLIVNSRRSGFRGNGHGRRLLGACRSGRAIAGLNEMRLYTNVSFTTTFWLYGAKLLSGSTGKRFPQFGVAIYIAGNR